MEHLTKKTGADELLEDKLSLRHSVVQRGIIVSQDHGWAMSQP